MARLGRSTNPLARLGLSTNPMARPRLSRYRSFVQLARKSPKRNTKKFRKTQAERFKKKFNLTSLGLTWVAVQGIHGLCVVTCNKTLKEVVQRLKSGLRGNIHPRRGFFASIRNAIISEVEGNGKNIFGGVLRKTFAFVNFNEGVGQVTQVEKRMEKAHRFLNREIKSNKTFTRLKTVKTAIEAFACLPRQNPQSILRVLIWKEGDIIANGTVSNI